MTFENSKHLTFALGKYHRRVAAVYTGLSHEKVIERIWRGDHTLWKPDPQEISNRLGWLRCPETMPAELPRLKAMVKQIQKEKYRYALLLGMGGSSLAPEVFRKTFGVKRGHLDLMVLDSTHPQCVQAFADQLQPVLHKTLFLVSTKSGGTVETLSFYRFFEQQVKLAVGAERVGEHFIAITDPNSSLARLAEQNRFRTVLLNDANIGGRYSALSFFGLLPAALLGIDLTRLLQRARQMAEACRQPENPALCLGTALGELAQAGRDKLTLLVSPAIASFGDWAEQLIAESTGKEKKGILPVVGKPPASPDGYGQDRLFVYLRLDGNTSYDQAVDALQSAGHPVITIDLKDPYDLGGQFFLWEMATAVAGHILSINPFDQPDVEAAKVLARQMVAEFQQSGALPETEPTLTTPEFDLYTYYGGETPRQVLQALLAGATPGAYLALQAYLPATADVQRSLDALRLELRKRTRLATTLGYGPRFLHSTGQLHKGDAGNGYFIQITATPALDVAIPQAGLQPSAWLEFGVLLLAQALGDRQALLNAGRKVLRFHLKGDLQAGLLNLSQLIQSLP